MPVSLSIADNLSLVSIWSLRSLLSLRSLRKKSSAIIAIIWKQLFSDRSDRSDNWDRKSSLMCLFPLHFYCLSSSNANTKFLWLILWFLLSCCLSNAVFLLYRKAFAPPRKSHRTGLLFTHKNGCGGATSVTKRNYVDPISKVERHIPDRFCVNLAMWTPFGTVAEMNKYERVLEPTEMEVTFKEYKEKILVHQTLSDNRTGTMFDMYDFCRPRPLLFILKRYSGT